MNLRPAFLWITLKVLKLLHQVAFVADDSDRMIGPARCSTSHQARWQPAFSAGGGARATKNRATNFQDRPPPLLPWDLWRIFRELLDGYVPPSRPPRTRTS